MRSSRSPRRSRAVLATATACAALASSFLLNPPASGAPETGAGATAMTFSDDFDGAAGTAPDPSKWVLETGNNDGNNHERQYYTNSTDNAALDGNGNLVITARKENPQNYQCWYGACEYTSARLNTSTTFTQAYGHVEARIKIPGGQGIWPAFWMLGDNFDSAGWPNCGELDVMENIGKEPSTVHGTLHGPGYSGGASIGAPYSIDGNFSDDFHTFAVDWSPESISWSVDGNVFQTRTPADLGGNQWVFDHPFYLILNLAVGGDWPGDPDGSTPFPSSMVIDYVHVNTNE